MHYRDLFGGARALSASSIKKGPEKSDPCFIGMCQPYSRLPMNCSKNMNRLMKSRYSCNAPWIADLSNQS